MQERLDEILDRIKEIDAALQKLTHQIVQGRKIAFRKEAKADDRDSLVSLEEQAKQLLNELKLLGDEMQQILGIPEEVIVAIEKERIEGDGFDTIPRKSIAHERIQPTNVIEKELPNALDTVLKTVNSQWLNSEKSKQWRLGKEFLTEPLSIIRGVRIESETRPIHRFAQTILTAEDLLHEKPEYDFFAGALLIPQLIALGSRLDDLTSASGSVQERIDALWQKGGEFVDSIFYELLVAGSCIRKGRKIEFTSPTSEKSPDLRVHNYPFPLVIECKRKQMLTQYEIEEESRMRHLFSTLYNAALKMGLRGRFHLTLNIEAKSMPEDDIVAVALRQRLTPDPQKPLIYNWGSIALYELPLRIEGPLTRLYSPNLLRTVFDWDFDMPEYDGIICKVDSPDSILVDYIENPIALLWTNNSPEAKRKRARSALSLYADATKQIPAGEMGLIYICYQEGAREKIADERTNYFVQEVRKWGHEPSIRIPVFFLTRLVARPLGDGAPDLIETGMRFISEIYGDQTFFIDFPSAVFTKS